MIEFKSRVGADGVLNLHVSLGQASAGADVIVTIRRASPSSPPMTPVNPQDWHQFVERTYGSCARLGLERQSQGNFEER
jgi:hypothetical protein